MYPRFSSRELKRRRDALLEEMAERDVEHSIIYGANRLGSPMQWLSGWPSTRHAILIVSVDYQDVLLVQFYNHVPNARLMTRDIDVRWGGTSTIATALEILKDRGLDKTRLGVIGALPFDDYLHCDPACKGVIDLNDWYKRTRSWKSDEEIEWMRAGANLTDLSMNCLRDNARPGMTEMELSDIVERPYVGRGGVNHIHFFAVTPMEHPTTCVPAQYPSCRTVEPGDVLITELSTSYWGYAGQALRTFAIAEEPSPRYQEMHAVADAAFDAITARIKHGVHASEIVESASLITDAGYAVYDDLVHGFGGDHLPAILVRRGETDWDVADFTFESGMTIVVQPNVISKDERAGVQTGELLLVTPTGVESLHNQERGLQIIGLD